jgi:hypothetical protein
MQETACDLRAFVKLADYDAIYNLAKNGAILAIEEVEEDELRVRKFTKPESIGNDTVCHFIAQFEFIHADNKMVSTNIADGCAFPLKCQIFHLKSNRWQQLGQKLPQAYDMAYSAFIVKNR